MATQRLHFDLDALKQFQEAEYSRNLVLKTAQMEIILTCWKPGHETPLHDHGISEGVALVIEGELFCQEVFPDGFTQQSQITTGEVIFTPKGVSHLLRNNSSQNAVTLNIYTPPLDANAKFLDLPYHNMIEIDPSFGQVLLDSSILQTLFHRA